MPITFVQQKKRQKYLILIFAAVLVVIAIVIWQGFFKQKTPTATITPPPPPREIKIDFSLFDKKLFKELQPFAEIQPLPSAGQTGRENPFLP
jgi:hypothetical protein